MPFMDALVTHEIPCNITSNLVFEDTQGCVSALKHIPVGEIWSLEEIQVHKRKLLFEAREWLVVENLRVHEDIKLGKPEALKYINNYKATLYNLAQCGVKTVFYSFSPLFYKVRTHFKEARSHYNFSMFDPVAFAVFDIYILSREGASNFYTGYQKQAARIFNSRLSCAEKAQLTKNILSCVEMEDIKNLQSLSKALENYRSVSNEDLTRNLEIFEEHIAPLAGQQGIEIIFRNSNPCKNLLGLPAVLR